MITVLVSLSDGTMVCEITAVPIFGSRQDSPCRALCVSSFRIFLDLSSSGVTLVRTLHALFVSSLVDYCFQNVD